MGGFWPHRANNIKLGGAILLRFDSGVRGQRTGMRRQAEMTLWEAPGIPCTL